jgi:hypothetical protein
MTKISIKIPETRRLIKRTGSLKINKNSRKRRVIPVKLALGGFDFSIEVCIILL